MDSLIFERKRGIPKNYEKPILLPTGKYRGLLAGEQVVVADPKEADELNAFGCFGDFLQRREPRVSVECFENNVRLQHRESSEVTSVAINPEDRDASSIAFQQTQRTAEAWKRLWPTDSSLLLGMEEAVYLSSELCVLHIFAIGETQKSDPDVVWKKFCDCYGIRFVRRYAVYRYFRRLGWVVRSGLQYGVDFMLYCDGPEYYHSSAAIRIVSGSSRDSVLCFAALNRELNNMKKALIEVTVDVPQDCDFRSVHCVHCIGVTHTTAFTWKTSDDR